MGSYRVRVEAHVVVEAKSNTDARAKAELAVRQAVAASYREGDSPDWSDGWEGYAFTSAEVLRHNSAEDEVSYGPSPKRGSPVTDPREYKDRRGFVYLMMQRANVDDPLYKIGITVRNPEIRRSALQAQNGNVVDLVASAWVWDARGEERYLHKAFEGSRQHGEWFALTPDDVAKVCDYFDNAHNTGDVDAIRQARRALDVVTGEDDRNDG